MPCWSHFTPASAIFLMAWVLTLPATMLISGGLFYLLDKPAF